VAPAAPAEETAPAEDAAPAEEVASAGDAEAVGETADDTVDTAGTDAEGDEPEAPAKDEKTA
jgi:hypothetical protein